MKNLIPIISLLILSITGLSFSQKLPSKSDDLHPQAKAETQANPEVDTQAEEKGLIGTYFTTSLSLDLKSQSGEGATIPSRYHFPIDYKLGYYFDGGFYLGGIYQQRLQRTSLSYSDYNHWGATVGISESGSYMNAHYLFSAEKSEAGKQRNGSGYALEMGHLYHVFECLSVGAQLSYQSMDYDGLKESGFQPMVSIGFNM